MQANDAHLHRKYAIRNIRTLYVSAYPALWSVTCRDSQQIRLSMGVSDDWTEKEVEVSTCIQLKLEFKIQH